MSPAESMPASFAQILQAQYELMRAAALGEETVLLQMLKRAV